MMLLRLVATTTHPARGAGPLWGDGQREGLSLGGRFGKEGQVALGHFLRSLPFSLRRDFWCYFYKERSCC